ncbi:hypothetical protein [Paraburkholderia sp. BCC1884]|uniref:hypothetical protein n=1 Tax=Paraburkholderia sp. BCC1884 TaxID=2562668 RepID=UPI00118249A8|nr:hypothetical protein [Paraburkholderia sp. BCC1884]
MKFSICLAVAALTLSASAYAQTSQTFHFGEGQSTMQPGKTQSGEHAAPRTQAKHSTSHHRRHRGHTTQPDTYSHN